MTWYLIHNYSYPFRFDPLKCMKHVPKYYLYEAVDTDLCVYVNPSIERIEDWAFAFCRINKLIISNKVTYIGDGALSLNEGEIVYEGTRQEFVSKFFGKSKCFLRSHNSHTIICTDGEIVV